MREVLGESGLLSDDQRPIVRFQENGMSYRAINNDEKSVLRYKIDGSMIISQSKKCDNALGVPMDNKIYLIELKGCDFKKATQQILETIIHLGSKLANYTVHGRVVCSRIQHPDLRASYVIRLERELAKRNGTLIKQTRMLEEII